MRKKFTLAVTLTFALAFSAGVGFANMNVEADAVPSLEITATSIRTADPAGLRFQTLATGLTADIMAQYPDAVAYTTVSFTSASGINYTTDVPATVWRPDGSGWNTVLLGIPNTDYATEVTAQSFIYDGETKLLETTAVTSSIAKTAAKAIANGIATDDEVGHYVSLTSITLDKASATIADNETLQLVATTDPMDFPVVWESDDVSVATVDNNGKVSALKAGKANITASMGGKTATCAVTVTWAETYSFDNGKTAPVSWIGNSDKAKQLTTKQLSDGNTVLDASNVLSDASDDQYIQMQSGYIDWVFEDHNYFTFTIYSNLPYIRYLYDTKVSANAKYLYGYNGNYLYYLEGTPVEGEDSLYKFAIAYNAEFYAKTSAVSGTTYSLKVGFTDAATATCTIVKPTVLYVDDFKAHCYTTDMIDFENGESAALDYGWGASWGRAMSVVKTDKANGSYAMKLDPSVSRQKIGVTASYLYYIFNEQGADYLEWKWYPETMPTKGTAIGISINGTRQTSNVSATLVDGTYYLIKLNKAAYTNLFNTDGTYKNGDITKLALFVGGYVLKDDGNSDWLKCVSYIDDMRPGWNS